MTSMRKKSFWGVLLIAVATIVPVSLMFGAQGQESPNASDIADGMRLYQQKGNCQACHGWAGDGRKTDSQRTDGSCQVRRILGLRDRRVQRIFEVTSK